MRREKKISRAAAEHVAQSNQYFLVTVGISVRNKPHRKSQPNSDTSENSSSERKMVSLFGDTVIDCHSLFLCYYTCLMTFVTELLFGTSFLLLLHHLLLLPSSHPWCCYYCDIFLSSIPEVIWLVKLHLFPRPLLGVLLFDFLSGWLQSLLPCPWSTTLAAEPLPIHRHGDDPTSITMETTFALWCATPTQRTHQSHSCLSTTFKHTCTNIAKIFGKILLLVLIALYSCELLSHCEKTESLTSQKREQIYGIQIELFHKVNSTQIDLWDASVTMICCD